MKTSALVTLKIRNQYIKRAKNSQENKIKSTGNEDQHKKNKLHHIYRKTKTENE